MPEGGKRGWGPLTDVMEVVPAGRGKVETAKEMGLEAEKENKEEEGRESGTKRGIAVRPNVRGKPLPQRGKKMGVAPGCEGGEEASDIAEVMVYSPVLGEGAVRSGVKKQRTGEPVNDG